MKSFRQLLEARSVTTNPKFKRWFNDSKVVDVQGKPLIVYHGTRAGGFTEFRPNLRKLEQLGFGIHFAEDNAFANMYRDDDTVARKGKAPQTYAAYLKAVNPLYADDIVLEGTPEFDFAKKLAGRKFWTMKNENGIPTAYIQHCIDATSVVRAEQIIRDANYDSVKYVSIMGTAGYGARITGRSVSWVVFEPTQIKSATDNNGDFDPSNPSIYA